jgi:dihydrolipoamide dehydrogenase
MSNIASDFDYDVIVIGAGPAGYAAAIRAVQLGFKTVCVDHWRNAQGVPKLGGTYVNAGCVACVSLLESASLHHLIKNDIATHGLHIEGLQVDLAQMVRRKEAIADELSQQIAALFAAHDITRLVAHARLLSAKQVELTFEKGGQKSLLTAKNIILASGSSPVKQACAVVNQDTILNVDNALALTSVPPELGILGAGTIGLEVAGIWHKLGAKITLFEAQQQFLPVLDHDLSKSAYQHFQAQGLDIRLGARVIATQATENNVSVQYQDATGHHSQTFDKLIVAGGRKPNSENLAAPEAQLLLDENGFVHVDENCATNLPGVYAIGDLNALGAMLAHKGIEEGVFVAEQIAGQQSSLNYTRIPQVIYTDPEIAWVGQTEQTLRAIGEPFKTALFPFHANAKAQAINKTGGFVKMLTHAETDKILGVHIIGSHAAELIAEAVLALEFSASSEDLARTLHAHPSLSSALHEAALILNDRALHLLKTL